MNTTGKIAGGSGSAAFVIWLAGQFGVEMSVEVAAAVAPSIGLVYAGLHEAIKRLWTRALNWCGPAVTEG